MRQRNSMFSPIKRKQVCLRPPKLKIKKGDQVEVIAGAERGRKGEVIKLDKKHLVVWVKGINLKTHYNKEKPEKGQTREESYLDYSNVRKVSVKKA